jgi:GTP-binding protein
MELKLLADVGFIGLPNAGKSTLLSVISDARPEIANYPFTTLTPELGVIKMQDGSAIVASDLPGIIKGAHLGKGLGLRFLRHAQRCKVLLFIIDGENSEDYYAEYKLLREEVKNYGYGLENRPFIVSVSKDESEETAQKIKAFAKKLKTKEVIGFSSLLNKDIDKLLNKVAHTLKDAPEIELLDQSGATVKYREYDLTATKSDQDFKITKISRNTYEITGEKVEERYAKYTLNSEEAILSLLNYLREIGVEQALEAAGIEDGDTVILVDFEFEYFR